MSCPSLPHISLSLLVPVAAAVSMARAADEPGDKKQDTARLGGKDSPGDLAAAIDRLLSKSTTSDLNHPIPNMTAAALVAFAHQIGEGGLVDNVGNRLAYACPK